MNNKILFGGATSSYIPKIGDIVEITGIEGMQNIGIVIDINTDKNIVTFFKLFSQRWLNESKSTDIFKEYREYLTDKQATIKFLEFYFNTKSKTLNFNNIKPLSDEKYQTLPMEIKLDMIWQKLFNEQNIARLPDFDGLNSVLKKINHPRYTNIYPKPYNIKLDLFHDLNKLKCNSLRSTINNERKQRQIQNGLEHTSDGYNWKKLMNDKPCYMINAHGGLLIRDYNSFVLPRNVQVILLNRSGYDIIGGNLFNQSQLELYLNKMLSDPMGNQLFEDDGLTVTQTAEFFMHKQYITNLRMNKLYMSDKSRQSNKNIYDELQKEAIFNKIFTEDDFCPKLFREGDSILDIEFQFYDYNSASEREFIDELDHGIHDFINEKIPLKKYSSSRLGIKCYDKIYRSHDNSIKNILETSFMENLPAEVRTRDEDFIKKLVRYELSRQESISRKFLIGKDKNWIPLANVTTPRFWWEKPPHRDWINEVDLLNKKLLLDTIKPISLVSSFNPTKVKLLKSTQPSPIVATLAPGTGWGLSATNPQVATLAPGTGWGLSATNPQVATLAPGTGWGLSATNPQVATLAQGTGWGLSATNPQVATLAQGTGWGLSTPQSKTDGLSMLVGYVSKAYPNTDQSQQHHAEAGLAQLLADSQTEYDRVHAEQPVPIKAVTTTEIGHVLKYIEVPEIVSEKMPKVTLRSLINAKGEGTYLIHACRGFSKLSYVNSEQAVLMRNISLNIS